MYYIRMSLMRPRAGYEAQVASIMDDLVTHYSKQPGYVLGYKLLAADEDGDVGRVTVWISQQTADAVAQSGHVLSVRSELLPLVEEDSSVERSFLAEDEKGQLAGIIDRLRAQGR